MANSAERSEPVITSIIMIVMIIVAVVGFGWGIKCGIEESFPPKQSITKPVNK